MKVMNIDVTLSEWLTDDQIDELFALILSFDATASMGYVICDPEEEEDG